MHKGTFSTVAWLMAFCACAGTQASGQETQVPPKLTLERLTTAAKQYFRDTAEFPLRQTTTFSVFDSHGHSRKQKTIHLDYVFQGYSRGRKVARTNLRAKISTWEALSGAKTVKVALNSALWLMIPGATLYSDPGEYKLEAQDSSGAGDSMITARLTPTKACGPFSMLQHKAMYFPDAVCGEGEFQLGDDLTFRKFVFETTELPATAEIAPFGHCTLLRYHVEVEFQKVLLPGDKEPLLVPQQVTATLETNKGKIVISSLYEPKPR